VAGVIEKSKAEWLNLTVLGWMTGGALMGRRHVNLPAVAGIPEITIEPVRTVDQQRWKDSPPFAATLLRRVTIVCELQRTLSPDAAAKYRELPHEAFRERSRVMGLDELTYAISQCVDLVKLFSAPNAQSPFAEALLRYRGFGAEDDHMTFYHPFRAGAIGADWAVTEDLASRLPTLWTNLLGGGNSAKVRFPLRRWGMSVQRQWDEDRLIDLWIGLEGLFKRDLEVRDIPEKIAPRIRDLLALDRKPTNRLQESYDARVAIAHGRSTYRDEDLWRAVDIADELLREALKALIQRTDQVDLFSRP
jgi:hypothetical protein